MTLKTIQYSFVQFLLVSCELLRFLRTKSFQMCKTNCRKDYCFSFFYTIVIIMYNNTKRNFNNHQILKLNKAVDLKLINCFVLIRNFMCTGLKFKTNWLKLTLVLKPEIPRFAASKGTQKVEKQLPGISVLFVALHIILFFIFRRQINPYIS